VAVSNHRENPNQRGTSFRCHCGSLLARLVPEGVELKCRRCKRQVIISLEPGEEKESIGQVCRTE
jgi:hypothetical protein